MPKRRNIIVDSINFKAVLEALIDESGLTKNEFIYKMAEISQADLLGTATRAKNWFSNKGNPNLKSLDDIGFATNYVLVFIPKENLPRKE